MDKNAVRGMTLVSLSVAVVAVFLASRAMGDPKPKLHDFMQQKLQYTQAVIEGVVMEDYDKIAKNAQALKLLSLESGWQIMQTSEYVEQSAAFRRAAEQLVIAGREKNMDRAALSYMDLTMRCVACHRYVAPRKRDLRIRE